MIHNEQTDAALTPTAEEVSRRSQFMNCTTDQLVYVAAKIGIADPLVDGPRTSKAGRMDRATRAGALDRDLRPGPPSALR